MDILPGPLGVIPDFIEEVTGSEDIHEAFGDEAEDFRRGGLGKEEDFLGERVGFRFNVIKDLVDGLIGIVCDLMAL